jgi:hypothetical protein
MSYCCPLGSKNSFQNPKRKDNLERPQGDTMTGANFFVVRIWILLLLLLGTLPSPASFQISNHLAISKETVACCCSSETCCCSELPIRECECVRSSSRSQASPVTADTKIVKVLSSLAQTPRAVRRKTALFQVRPCFPGLGFESEVPLPQRLGLHHFCLPPPRSCVNALS